VNVFTACLRLAVGPGSTVLIALAALHARIVHRLHCHELKAQSGQQLGLH
jgi:hypothetical protein